MFQVQAPVVIVPSTEARAALGVQLRAGALAAWLEIARRGKGIEMARFQIAYTGVTLVVCTRVRPGGFIEIELGIRDPGQAARVILARAITAGQGSGPRPQADAPVKGGLSRAASLLPPHPHVH